MKTKCAIFPCLLLIILTYNGYAQTKDSLNRPDGLEVRKFSPADSTGSLTDTDFAKKDFSENDTILKWKQSRDFAYMHFLDSLLRKQKDIKSDTVRFDESSGKIIRKENSQTEVSSFSRILNSPPFRIFFWILAVIFIIFICYKVLFKNGIFGRRKNKLLSENEVESVEDLQDVSEYDALISDAETKQNYNLAIRYLFLKTLKSLSDRGFVSFTIEKTNQEYLKEMGQNPHSKEFEDVIRNYEYVWYGKHRIFENQYLQLKELFYLFNKII
jgi:hypothetical protein